MPRRLTSAASSVVSSRLVTLRPSPRAGEASDCSAAAKIASPPPLAFFPQQKPLLRRFFGPV
jgi:hypothetical protein